MEGSATRRVPSWTYQHDYYALALTGTGMAVVTDAVKGKGLYATRPFAADSTVHEETALCCSQNMDDFNEGVRVCPLCLRSLETPRTQVARNTRRKRAALALPHPELHMPVEPVPCLWREQGCTECFCSVRCRESALQLFHWVCCTGRMAAPQRTAHAAFMRYDWVQNGVDYSDTAMLGLRIAAQTVCAHRLRHVPIEEAFEPYAQLIRSPVSSFYFTYLLMEDIPCDGADSAAVAAHAAAFEASRHDPLSVPAVKAAYAPGTRDKDAFCAASVSLLHDVLDMSPTERDFLHARRWSELMGAVLLNGQERAPPSPYELHRELVSCLPDGAAAMAAFEATAHPIGSGGGMAPGELSRSSRGQGIYGVGCLFNHSCDPNVIVQYSSANDETLSVVALRDVAVGEELTISYIDTSLPVAVRQQQLQEHYLFECGCSRCVQERSGLPACRAGAASAGAS
ncbi:SET domain containing protein [Novymonas esmeraldas]|uniref:SET domain containing protein n=1 Tax=Novymonas esmeraldas TaxID=1808958 RepID=A0AAW0FGI8_9TRYP